MPVRYKNALFFAFFTRSVSPYTELTLKLGKISLLSLMAVNEQYIPTRFAQYFIKIHNFLQFREIFKPCSATRPAFAKHKDKPQSDKYGMTEWCY